MATDKDNKTIVTRKLAGADVHLYVNGTCIAGQADCSLSQERILIDTTCKGDTVDTVITRLNSWSMECTGFLVTNDKGLTALLDAYDFGEVVTVELKHKKYKDYYRTGEALVVNFEESNNFNEATSYTVKLKGISQLARIKE